MSGSTSRTIDQVVQQARTLLQDTVETVASSYRYSDQDIMDNFNGAMIEARRLRPDLFLAYGLRTPLPLYTLADLGNPSASPPVASTAFPLDEQYFMAAVYYVVGRAELREDTFSDNSRAIALMNKFTSQLMQAAA
jgi:hypothetical protein